MISQRIRFKTRTHVLVQRTNVPKNKQHRQQLQADMMFPGCPAEFFRSSFLLPACHNAVHLLWSGLGTEKNIMMWSPTPQMEAVWRPVKNGWKRLHVSF